MAEKSAGPDTPSSDYTAMLPYWEKVGTLLSGAEAMRAAGPKYLPQFPNESVENYDYRRTNAKYTNVYRDITENLAAKPFAKELKLDDGAPEALKAIAEDIDARGNHIHVFAGQVFFAGVNNAVDFIFVDHTRVPLGATLADERALGARPYWVRIPADRMIAVYSDMINGKEEIVHARFMESAVEREGFAEIVKERIRFLERPKLPNGIYAPAQFVLYEKQEKKNASGGTEVEWIAIDGGPISIGVIPLVPFLTGRRIDGSWRILPPMQDAADLQISMYQQETNLERAKELTAFPMLAANGISPPLDASGAPMMVPVGPGAVLYAPPNDGGGHGQWGMLEPGASSLVFLAAECERTERQLRELGRQPLTAQSGNLTVVTTMFAAQKGNSAIQAWALNLKDALEQALKLTCQWLRINAEPEVKIHTDFSIESEDAQAPAALMNLRRNGDLSQKTLWAEMQRRNILSAEFDPELEEQHLMDEAPDPDEEADLLAAIPSQPGQAPRPVNGAARVQ